MNGLFKPSKASFNRFDNIPLSGLKVIGLRLELAAAAVDGKLYGFKLWQSIPNIAKEAVLLYTVSAAKSRNEAASFLGIKKEQFRTLIKKFGIKDYLNR